MLYIGFDLFNMLGLDVISNHLNFPTAFCWYG